jgi:predicted peroxiredoxin
MKTTLAAAALALSAALPAQADDGKSLVTILTAPDAQTQLMAMVLTMQSAKQGATPHILLCGPAADMALKEAPATATDPQEPMGFSPQMLMQKIAGMPGAKVEVCAIYLPNKGAGPEVLLDGIAVAKPGEMAKAMLDADARMSF